MQEIRNDFAQQDDVSFTYIGDVNDVNVSGVPLNVRNLIIAEDVEYLPNGFCMCRLELSQVQFPARLILIGLYAFRACPALTHIAFPSCLISIGHYAFGDCTSLMTVSLPEGLQRIGKFSFSNCHSLQRIHVPSTVETIEDYAFSCCRSLVQVTLFEGLVNIGKGAFRECLSLRDMELPQTTQKIEEYAFSNCHSLQRIHVPSTVEKIEDWVFSYCKALVQVILSEGLVTIGNSAFRECFSLRDMELPRTVEEIGESAFQSCHSLQRVQVPSTVETIQEYAFLMCKSLRDISIPSSCQLLPSVFRGCSSLEDFEIPSTWDSIPEMLFWECSSLTNVELHHGLGQIGNGAFLRASSLVTIKLPPTITVIGNAAFSGCVSLEEVVLCEGLVEIRTFSFRECASLTRIKIPSTVNLIGWMAFWGCNNLISMEFPPSMQGPLRIDERAIANCDSLVNFALPSESEVIIDPLQNVMVQIGLEMGIDVAEALYERFDGDPIHKKCYHSCDTTLDGLRHELEDRDLEKSGVERRIVHADLFDMTPFHVLLSASSCRLDLLKLLLQNYPPYVLDWKDILGKRAIEYLSSNRNQEARVMMESYLQRWWIERLAGCGIKGWRSDMTQRAIVVVLEEDRARRNNAIGDAYRRMKGYEKSERMSLLELALWKNAMAPCDSGSQAVSDREAHRANSGATFVVPHVIAYLENCFENNDAERWFCPPSTPG